MNKHVRITLHSHLIVSTTTLHTLHSQLCVDQQRFTHCIRSFCVNQQRFTPFAALYLLTMFHTHHSQLPWIRTHGCTSEGPGGGVGPARRTPVFQGQQCDVHICRKDPQGQACHRCGGGWGMCQDCIQSHEAQPGVWQPAGVILLHTCVCVCLEYQVTTCNHNLIIIHILTCHGT